MAVREKKSSPTPFTTSSYRNFSKPSHNSLIALDENRPTPPSFPVLTRSDYSHPAHRTRIMGVSQAKWGNRLFFFNGTWSVTPWIAPFRTPWPWWGCCPRKIGTILADSRIAFRSLPVGSPFVPLPPRNIPPSAVHLSSTADYTEWHQWIIDARMTGCSSELHSGKWEVGAPTWATAPSLTRIGGRAIQRGRR